VGFGKTYFKVRWNLLDFFVVVFSSFALIFDKTNLIGGNTAAIAMRNIKLLRIIQIVKQTESFRVIIYTILISFTGLL